MSPLTSLRPRSGPRKCARALAALRQMAAHYTHTRPDKLERMAAAVGRATEPEKGTR